MAQFNDIGIDLGTSNVFIYMRGKGIILNEPSIVAIERDTRKVLAIGNDAQLMLGRTPSNILAIQPLRQGVITDFDLTGTMLRYFMQKVIGKRLFSRPRAVMSVPSGVNEIEKRSIISVMFDAGMRRTQLLEKPMAAAIGAKLPIDETYGTMIVDIGAGVTDIAVISMGQIIVSGMSKVGGDQFTDAIIRHLRRKHNLLIGERTAEELKVNIGSVLPRSEQIYLDVTGKNILTGIPKTMRITSDEVTEALDDPLQAFIESLHAALENTPAELAADVFERGIYFTGGGAALFGLEEAVEQVLKVPCHVVSNPQTSVVRGCGEVLENPKELNRFLDDGRKRYNNR